MLLNVNRKRNTCQEFLVLHILPLHTVQYSQSPVICEYSAAASLKYTFAITRRQRFVRLFQIVFQPNHKLISLLSVLFSCSEAFMPLTIPPSSLIPLYVMNRLCSVKLLLLATLTPGIFDRALPARIAHGFFVLNNRLHSHLH